MTTDVDADRTSQIGEMANQAIAATRRLGKQTAFYGSALAATADAVRRYPGEVLRLIAVMGMGTGALAVIGGTVVIVGFLTLSTGALIAVQGYNTLSNVGIEALTGFLGAFLNVRFIAPATAGVALAATIGAGATAQLGAMRINEEIDALEVMGIRVITYLAATRIVAGVVASHEAALLPWLDGPPQTNEAGRSASIMAALLWLSQRLGPRFELNELGASAGVNLYPDGSATFLRRALSARHGIPFEQVVIGSGSSELIDICMRTFVDPGDEVVVPQGIFRMFPVAVAGALMPRCLRTRRAGTR